MVSELTILNSCSYVKKKPKKKKNLVLWDDFRSEHRSSYTDSHSSGTQTREYGHGRQSREM